MDQAETLVRDHAEPAWRLPRRAGEWSAAEALAHLRAADAILAPRLMQVAVRDEPFLPAFDERAWQEVADFVRLPVSSLVQTFAAQRFELLHALERLPQAAWRRSGVHEARGPLRMHEIAQGIVAHEREHLDQIESALAGPA
jgi:hypothetical protein